MSDALPGGQHDECEDQRHRDFSQGPFDVHIRAQLEACPDHVTSRDNYVSDESPAILRKCAVVYRRPVAFANRILHPDRRPFEHLRQPIQHFLGWSRNKFVRLHRHRRVKGDRPTFRWTPVHRRCGCCGCVVRTLLGRAFLLRLNIDYGYVIPFRDHCEDLVQIDDKIHVACRLPDQPRCIVLDECSGLLDRNWEAKVPVMVGGFGVALG